MLERKIDKVLDKIKNNEGVPSVCFEMLAIDVMSSDLADVEKYEHIETIKKMKEKNKLLGVI